MLRFFGKSTEDARSAYHSYVEDGIHQGRKDELSGGGLKRSLNGWSEIKNQRRRVKGDQRILGDSNFVLKILTEAGEHYERKSALKNKGFTIQSVAAKVAALYYCRPQPECYSNGSDKTNRHGALCHQLCGNEGEEDSGRGRA